MDFLTVASLSEILQVATLTAALITNAVAVVIIGAAVVMALFRTFQAFGAGDGSEERPRLGLARALGLGLEFLLAADIMRTAVAPTWTEIGQLAAIAALRTALNFFIQRELDAAARRRKADGAELSDKETRAQFP